MTIGSFEYIAFAKITLRAIKLLMCKHGDFMNLENMSITAIAEELGARLKTARLNADLTQEEVSARSGLHRSTVLNAEKGNVQLKNLIAILTAMGMVNQLNMFLPEPGISPLQLAKLKGHERQRASGAKKAGTSSQKDENSW